MSWLRTDDAFCHHPKFEGWPAAKRWAFLELMHYCARYQTAGRVPQDISLLPKLVTKKIVNEAIKSGWIDVDSDGEMWIHDWEKYNPSDPTKTARQARWRAKRNGHVDTPEPSTAPSTPPSTSRARLPSPTPTPDQEQGSNRDVFALTPPPYEAKEDAREAHGGGSDNHDIPYEDQHLPRATAYPEIGRLA